MKTPNIPTHRASLLALTNFNQLVSTASRVSVAAIAATLLQLGAPSVYANNTATETFDFGLGKFTTTSGLTIMSSPTNQFDMGWFNSGNASGSPGEIGGLVQRYSSPVSPTAPGMPYILDTGSFTAGPLDVNSPIMASGKMYLMNPGSAGGDLNLGFWDYNATDPSTERLVLRIHSPSGSPTDWRFRLADGDSSTGRQTLTGSDSKQLDFSFLFSPSGGGMGTFTGSVSDGTTTLNFDLGSIDISAYNLNCFGIWVDSAGSTADQPQYMYFDNFSYSVVPEPSAALLLPFGMGLLLLARRKFRRA